MGRSRGEFTFRLFYALHVPYKLYGKKGIRYHRNAPKVNEPIQNTVASHSSEPINMMLRLPIGKIIQVAKCICEIVEKTNLLESFNPTAFNSSIFNVQQSP